MKSQAHTPRAVARNVRRTDVGQSEVIAQEASEPPTKQAATKPVARLAPVAPQESAAKAIFNMCVERANNLLRVHKEVHGEKKKPPKHLSDLHRAAIVMAISALDAYVRTYLLTTIRMMLSNRQRSLPAGLADRIKNFLKPDDMLDAARKDDLLERVEKAFRADFERKSFQGTQTIEQSMQLVGINDVFHEVAISTGANEDQLKLRLDEFTSRRHNIAHRGDCDLSQKPPQEAAINKTQAQECIRLVKSIVEGIERIKV